MLQKTSLKEATSRFARLEEFSLPTFFKFVSRVNLLHLKHFCFFAVNNALLSLWYFSVELNYYFQFFFILKVILFVAKMTRDSVKKLL